METVKAWGSDYSHLTFRFNDANTEYTGETMDTKAFYDKMRSGGIAKTSAINPSGFISIFEKYLERGLDILYLGFSSGLSTTYRSGVLAANELSAKYPEGKILCVDTLCASAGQGLLLKLAMDKKASGATIEETRDYAESVKLNVCHWFTVDDLVYLKRGGRVSATTAFVGNMLGIKPVMHVDNEGHLVNVSKVRGRRAAILAMADKYGELHLNDEGYVYISHGDCIADAELLAKTIEEKYGKKTEIITSVGPVIGAHSGPGTLALFFVGKES
jgi:DegV family protein with EDD domain